MKQSVYLDRLALFPNTTEVTHNRGILQISIAGISLLELAQEYGTPLYIYDRQTMDQSVQAYREALSASYPGESGVTYAGKSFLCLAIAEWAQQQNLWLDCSSANELELAVRAGFSKENLVQHGVSKTISDLSAAIHNAGTIVIDNLSEIERFLKIIEHDDSRVPDLWLRLRPGLEIESHGYTKTGGETSKFGFGPQEFETALVRLHDRGLELKGLHFHLGSQLHDPLPMAPAVDKALDLIVSFMEKYGWHPAVLCPGGGWGVPYHEADLPHQTISDYVSMVCEHIIAGCKRRGLSLPRLQLEPGRSLSALAGVAVYQIQAIKHAHDRRWLLVDGGLADNPRPALYQARYSALPVVNPDRTAIGPAWIGGPYCESGDFLISDLPMPEVEVGEYLVIPVSGAYQLSMSSNYNGALRPNVLWLENGTARLIRRRETIEDLLMQDISLYE